jgi:hypothetical protein
MLISCFSDQILFFISKTMAFKLFKLLEIEKVFKIIYSIFNKGSIFWSKIHSSLMKEGQSFQF